MVPLGWRNGLVVKSTGCTSGGPRFDSQYPRGGSQPSVIPVPRDPTPLSGVLGHQPCACHTDIHPGKILLCIKYKIKTNLKNDFNHILLHHCSCLTSSEKSLNSESLSRLQWQIKGSPKQWCSRACFLSSETGTGGCSPGSDRLILFILKKMPVKHLRWLVLFADLPGFQFV